MCEPSHSIIQMPPDDNDSAGSAQAGEVVRGRFGQLFEKWTKKIRGIFHYSKMGHGHSEAAGVVGLPVAYLYDDIYNKYEAHWWNRRVVEDGCPIKVFDGLELATEYANNVSIGDLGKLRRFLEESMKVTTSPYGYYSNFRDGFLNSRGKAELDCMLKERFNINYRTFTGQNGVLTRLQKHRDGIIKTMLGLTRKRKLIVPEWADDDKLWTPANS